MESDRRNLEKVVLPNHRLGKLSPANDDRVYRLCWLTSLSRQRWPSVFEVERHYYRQDCANRKLSVLNLLTGQKSSLSPSSGDSFTDSCQTWHSRRACGSAWLCKISPQSAQGGWECGPKYEKCPLFCKESPRRGETFDRFLEILCIIIRPTIPH